MCGVQSVDVAIRVKIHTLLINVIFDVQSFNRDLYVDLLLSWFILGARYLSFSELCLAYNLVRPYIER